MTEITDKQRLDWLEKKVVQVRIPLRYGSKDLFWSSPDIEDDVSDLRNRIDECIKTNK